MDVVPDSFIYNSNSQDANETRQSSMSDPLVDAPMLVTLDQLRPYDLNPRIMRNPRYEEIKASIRQRGLDTTPSITRRPGEQYFRIRNGGNTRLAILRELWSETKDMRFFELACLFRPWPERGEIIALTGHLAENELRGKLTFIERALGVEKARELYEQESGTSLSQSELSRRLTDDGYPVQQSHISRMRDAVEHLLPSIPNLLYGGLGRHQIERLAVMRRSCERIWDAHSPRRTVDIHFAVLFHEALQTFDGAPSTFNFKSLQDEVIGQMAMYLGIDYDTLMLAAEMGENRDQALAAKPQPSLLAPIAQTFVQAVAGQSDSVKRDENRGLAPVEDETNGTVPVIPVSAARRAVDENPPYTDVLPFTQGSLYPISDIWNIDPGLDDPQRLRVHISQFAREICLDVASADLITEVEEGIGFRFCPETNSARSSPTSLIVLLETLTSTPPSTSAPIEIGPLLLGSEQSGLRPDRLSDASLVKLFRLIRLARHLIDLQSNNDSSLMKSSTVVI